MRSIGLKQREDGVEVSVILDPDINLTGRERPHGATQTLRAILGELRAGETQSAAGFSDTASQSDDGKASAGDMSADGAEASLGDVLDRLDERAFGLLLLLLALPCCLPFVYLLPQLVALPMLALAGQLAAGREHPWLPARFRDRRFAISSFEGVLTRAEKYVGWFEKLSRPRLTMITDRMGARLVGLLLLAPTASILVPLPSTNTVPGLGVAIASIGLIERDGFLVLAGLLIGFVWIGLLAFFGLEAASLIKDWASGLV